MVSGSLSWQWLLDSLVEAVSVDEDSLTKASLEGFRHSVDDLSLDMEYPRGCHSGANSLFADEGLLFSSAGLIPDAEDLARNKPSSFDFPEGVQMKPKGISSGLASRQARGLSRPRTPFMSRTFSGRRSCSYDDVAAASHGDCHVRATLPASDHSASSGLGIDDAFFISPSESEAVTCMPSVVHGVSAPPASFSDRSVGFSEPFPVDQGSEKQQQELELSLVGRDEEGSLWSDALAVLDPWLSANFWLQKPQERLVRSSSDVVKSSSSDASSALQCELYSGKPKALERAASDVSASMKVEDGADAGMDGNKRGSPDNKRVEGATCVPSTLECGLRDLGTASLAPAATSQPPAASSGASDAQPGGAAHAPERTAASAAVSDGGTGSAQIPSKFRNQEPPQARQPWKGRFLIPPQSETECGSVDGESAGIASGARKTLVLDLDETLVHALFDPPPPQQVQQKLEDQARGKKVKRPDFSFDLACAAPDGGVLHVSVVMRPGMAEFLRAMARRYEIVLFTASMQSYADKVLDVIDPEGLISHRLFRDSCTCFASFASGVPEYNFVKDLSRLGRDLGSVIIVDNSPAAYSMHPDNGVAVTSFFDDADDVELVNMIPMLEALAGVEGDVREVIRRRRQQGQQGLPVQQQQPHMVTTAAGC